MQWLSWHSKDYKRPLSFLFEYYLTWIPVIMHVHWWRRMNTREDIAINGWIYIIFWLWLLLSVSVLFGKFTIEIIKLLVNVKQQLEALQQAQKQHTQVNGKLINMWNLPKNVGRKSSIIFRSFLIVNFILQMMHSNTHKLTTNESIFLYSNGFHCFSFRLLFVD